MPELRSLDPRPKMMILICISSSAMMTADIRILFALTLFTLLILLAGGVRFRDIVRQAKSAVNLVAFLFILQCLFNRTGKALLLFSGFTLVTDTGFLTAAMLSLRLLIIILSALILMTGEARDYLLALIQCGMPYELAFMVMLAIRFFPILREEAFNVYYSVQLRGTEIEKASLPARLSAYSRLCLPILVAALERAKTMSIAMEAKCFRAFPERTYMRRLTLAARDKICLVIFPVGLVILLLFSHGVFSVLAFASTPHTAQTAAAAPLGTNISSTSAGIILSWTGNPQTTQTITWSTAKKAAETLQYISGSSYAAASTDQKRFSKSTGITASCTEVFAGQYYRYEATITGLSPGQKYYYRVGNGTAWSVPKYFVTEAKNPQTSSFMYLGDVQFELRDEDYATWGTMIRKAYAANPGIAFSLMGGDYVNSSANIKDWQVFLGQAASVFSQIPMMTVPGNHETSITPAFYLKMLALPKNNPTVPEEIYSFDYGDCHFVMLNSCVFMPERENKLGEKNWNQLISDINDWIKTDLSQSTAKWNIVVLHHPPYPVSEDDGIYSLLRQNWEPLFIKGNVDLVLCGHQHVTMRTSAISGITYFMGNSGVKRSMYYDGRNAPAYKVFLNAGNSTYQIIKADTESLTLTTFSESGKKLDFWSKADAKGNGNGKITN